MGTVAVSTTIVALNIVVASITTAKRIKCLSHNRDAA
jgi:hypothetical protein